MINVFLLKFLKIKGICGFGFCLIENVMELVEVSIIDVFSIFNENFLGFLILVKCFLLRIFFLKVDFFVIN